MDARSGGSDRADVERTLTRLGEAMLAARARYHRTVALRNRGLAAFVEREAPDGDAMVERRHVARNAVIAFVWSLREAGATPQRMLIDVKDVVRMASPVPCDEETRRALVDDVVRWSIEAFYDDGGRVS